MTAAPEIPADVMAAAQKTALSWFATSEDGIYREPLTYFIARAILAERERCVEAVKSAPHFIYHSEEEFAETGMIGRQANRNDLAAAIQGPTT